jgi:hypothetical protein
MVEEDILKPADGQVGAANKDLVCGANEKPGFARKPGIKFSFKIAANFEIGQQNSGNFPENSSSGRERRGERMKNEAWRFEIYVQRPLIVLKSFLAVLQKRLAERSSSQDLIAWVIAMSVKISLTSRSVEALPCRGGAYHTVRASSDYSTAAPLL